ncbi:threonine ammonia-lyase [Arcobacter sp. FWKO B]|uniref:threonine ammonia-lyase n=1 Tax=Arcobacter sp. FWKO B TaxID=2593672 RepID=UPI0018A3EC42|nr:threonine ammonia-lyase [Arcobacter sp. FWKO B]QOG12512.1 threonine ammonia-lyase [Arcobacter sp. FWKO B]
MVTLKDITDARKRLDGIIHKTPLAFAPTLSKNHGGEIYIKKENLQLTGSFKLRGAFNKIALLNESQKKAGVVASSAGNHAQGVAFAAKYFGIEATIFMPETTPLTKVSGVRDLGANVVLKGGKYDEAYMYAKEYSEQLNKTFVHPYADDEVIAGQGTIALEILDQIKDIDTFVVPIGGGGLISGIAIAAKAINPNIKVIGVVASGARAMKDSYEAKTPIDSIDVKTIADGIAVRDVSPKMLDLVLEHIDEVVEVEDKEIANAILFLVEKQKLVVEGAGAAGVAAVMHGKVNTNGAKIALPLSGGNIDVTMLSLIIEKGLVKSSRKMNLMVTLVDKPGSLTRLTEIFRDCQANIVYIDYDRNSVQLDFGDANITISLETKGEVHQEEIRNMLKSNGYRFKEL